jgi:hypothetical protein
LLRRPQPISPAQARPTPTDPVARPAKSPSGHGVRRLDSAIVRRLHASASVLDTTSCAPLFSRAGRAPARPSRAPFASAPPRHCPGSPPQATAAGPSQISARKHQRVMPRPSRAPQCLVAHPPPLPIAWEALERRRPWPPEPATMAVRHRPSLRPSPSKVSSPMCSPWSPLRFPLLTRAPRPPGHRRRHPPAPPPPCSPLDRGRARPLLFLHPAP